MARKTRFGCSLALRRIGRLQQSCDRHRGGLASACRFAAALGGGRRKARSFGFFWVKDLFRKDMEPEGREQSPEHGTGNLVEFETVHARLARENCAPREGPAARKSPARNLTVRHLPRNKGSGAICRAP